MCEEREATLMASSPTHDSAVSACCHGCLTLLHRHFSTQSPPSCPLSLSLCSQQQALPWDCSTIPTLQPLATAPSRGPASLSGIHMTATRTVSFSFHLGCHRSAVSFSALTVSPLTQTIAPMWGLTPASVSPHARGKSSPTNIPVFFFFPLVPSSY